MTRHVYGIEEQTIGQVTVWRFPTLALLRMWLRQRGVRRWMFADDDRIRRACRKGQWHTADDGVGEYAV